MNMRSEKTLARGSTGLLLSAAIVLMFTSGCSKLRDPAAIQDEEACHLCHTLPPSEESGHILQFAGTYNYDCSVCHAGYDIEDLIIDETVHKNGRVDLQFNTEYLDTTFKNGYDSPSPMAFDGETCTNIPCHGYGLTGDEGTFFNADSSIITAWDDTASYIEWTVNASLGDTLGCSGCHKTDEHKAGKDCDNCHELVTGKDTGNNHIANYSLHINGRLDRDRRN